MLTHQNTRNFYKNNILIILNNQKLFPYRPNRKKRRINIEDKKILKA